MGSWNMNGRAKATVQDSTEQESRPRGSVMPWGSGSGGRKVKLLDSLFDEPKLVFDESGVRNQKLSRYFSLGGVRKIKQHLSDNTVVRNRIVFVSFNVLIFGYIGFSLLFG